MKRTFILLVSLCSFSVLAQTPYSHCPLALPDNQAGFCASFKSVASCHCQEMGIPSGMCQDMNVIYGRMVQMFGSQEKACHYQHDTSYEICMDDWNCYRKGGSDSKHALCNATGNRC